MKNHKRHLHLILAMAVWVSLAGAHQARGEDPHQHGSMMGAKERADQGMGFDQARTTHHFLLKPDGGVISVEANDGKDTESRDQVRMHLPHIAKAFAAGDFDIPMFVHDQVPPGVAVMKAKKAQIEYRFEETEKGGRVIIASHDAGALAAIHDFLAFQIREHKTGDSLTVH
ncbi:MAG TPA: hypothetical protein VMT28_04295 [Terriglobales bacterium]|jgi:hypothetical protein|nr:hypothetical protein [Terriglobales bacterium]